MNLYVTRHGETEWNAKDFVCGTTDIDLTEKGREQAAELGKRLAELSIDVILVSPLRRAQETCHIAEAVRNEILVSRGENVKRPQIITEQRLIEQCYGTFEGKDRLGEAFLNNKKMFAYRYPEGESQIQTACRVYALIDEVKEKYADKNVLFVCHGGVARIIHTYFYDMTNDEFFRHGMGNCELRKYLL